MQSLRIHRRGKAARACKDVLIPLVFTRKSVKLVLPFQDGVQGLSVRPVIRSHQITQLFSCSVFLHQKFFFSLPCLRS